MVVSEASFSFVVVFGCGPMSFAECQWGVVGGCGCVVVDHLFVVVLWVWSP